MEMTTRQQQQQQQQRKRRQQPVVEEFVDDLAVAAQYAIAVPKTSTSGPKDGDKNEETEDENEIALEESSSSSSASHDEVPQQQNGDETAIVLIEPAAVGGAAVEDVQANQQEVVETAIDDDSEDAESDVDLTEQLARMDEGDDEDAAPAATAANSKPMTANEIDAYQADLTELQDQFHWNVALETDVGAASASSQWTVAGSLQHHMVEERTVVVLSKAGGVLLQEGSLLVLNRNDLDGAIAMDNIPAILPLGKILEVFGPVSQPLYSIRLALPTRLEKSQKGEHKVTEVVDQTGEKSLGEAANKEKIKSPDASSRGIEILSSTVPTATSGDKPVDEPVSASDAVSGGDDPDAVPVSVATKAFEPETSVQRKADTTTVASQPMDPWSKNGAYTRLLIGCPKLPVYFLHDATGRTTTVLDTAAVYRNSGRGCDASNIFDEEILDVQDFSDDEQERMAKGQRNKKKGREVRGRDHRERDERQGEHRSQNQSRRYTPHQGFHANTAYAHPPQGFHQGMQQRPSFPLGFHQSVSQQPPSYPSHPMTPPYYAQHGMIQPPPHYPQPGQGYHPNMPPPQQYYYGANPNAGQPPPPPPPPGAPQQHPQDGESDTVYYDFS
jgi:hypothetical protein